MARISENGYLKFVDEFKRFSEVEKPYWVKEKEIAAQHGDRSENAEYISAKEMIRNLDKRLRFLQKILDQATVIQTQKLSHERINFGSKVLLLDLDTNKELTYVILGTNEANPSQGIISDQSPLGKQLLGKNIGDEISLTVGEKLFEYEILEINAYDFKAL